MIERQDLQDIFRLTNARNIQYVEQLLNEGQGTKNSRKWEKVEEWGQDIATKQGTEFEKEMRTRQITIRMGPDILRWGYSIKGTFTIKEAYKLKAEQEQDGQALLWKKIWKGGLWPKVAHFLWLVFKGRILT